MSKTFQLGVFVVGTLLIFVIGIFLIGRKQFLFSATYRLKAEFDHVAGLGNGAEVRVAGIHEGTVRGINLPERPDGKVTVTMDLERSTRHVIKKDSVASIKTEGLIGDKYVEISFGSDQAEDVESGDTIGSNPPLDMSDLMKKANAILDSTERAVDNVGETSNHLKAISAKIDHGDGTLGQLINNKEIYQRANSGVAAFQENMEALKSNFFLRGFFKRRGYENSEDLAKHAIGRLPSRPYSRRFAYDAKGVFESPDAAALKNKEVFNEAGQFLEHNKFELAVVSASTGMKGDSDHARLLTQAWSLVVRDHVVSNFRLDDIRVKTLGRGKSEGTGDGGMVEILVYKEG
ncbi:MAG: MCE family protein [Acidobacteria bacterium]|nr:MCE family protein [Acidobacteriota bacterium]